jgi:CHAT domain-containing protein
MEPYEDFNVRIVADGESFQVLAQSPAGKASSPFEIPVDLSPWNRSAAFGTRDLGRENICTPLTPEKTGDRLFQALLSDSVRRLWDRTLSGNPTRNVRIRLHIDPRDERLRPLAALPWELLYCADTCEFLNLNRRTPVVRSLDVLRREVPVALTPPLRVLLVMANPEGSSKLDLADERSRVEKALRTIGGVEPRVLEHATTKGLQRCLAAENFQIVHFMGHGSFQDHSAEGVVLLENADGGGDEVSGEVLATLLKQRAGPALVILNACRTAKSSERRDAPPFSGVAAALVGKGIPAVLAMQTVVGDDAAITLAETIYERLTAGDPIEAAVSEARLALYAVSQSPPDWAIPALFVRSVVLSPAPERQQEPNPPPISALPEKAPSQQINNFGEIEKQFNIQGTVHFNDD